MTSLKERKEAIKNLQKILNRKDLTEIERLSYYDSLARYVDRRALLIMQGCKDKPTQEEEN